MAQPALAKSRFSNVRCLLVEDSEFDQRRIKLILDELGVGYIDIVSTMAAARLHLVRQRVDVILLDNGLPDGFGVDLALELKESPRFAKIPVFIVSDWPTPFMFDKALVARTRKVLSKDNFNLQQAADAMACARGMQKNTPS